MVYTSGSCYPRVYLCTLVQEKKQVDPICKDLDKLLFCKECTGSPDKMARIVCTKRCFAKGAPDLRTKWQESCAQNAVLQKVHRISGQNGKSRVYKTLFYKKCTGSPGKMARVVCTNRCFTKGAPDLWAKWQESCAQNDICCANLITFFWREMLWAITTRVICV